MDLADEAIVVLDAFVMKCELFSYLLFVISILFVVFFKVVINLLELVFHSFLDVFLPLIQICGLPL